MTSLECGFTRTSKFTEKKGNSPSLFLRRWQASVGKSCRSGLSVTISLKFSARFGKVRLQVLGEAPEEQVVMISVPTLAHLIRLVDGSVSFAEALAAQPGFKPVDARIEMHQRPRAGQIYISQAEGKEEIG